MMKRLLIIAASLAVLPVARADFIVPDFPVDGETAFSWWTGFSDPFTDYHLPAVGETIAPFPVTEGNAPNGPDSTNFDARLIQNGPEEGAIISSSGGLYGNSGSPTEFLVLDQPDFEPDSVLLQLRSIGTIPDLESAVLFYRETENGVLKVADGPSGYGYLQEGGSTFVMWEWDLSDASVFDFFISFAASGSSMSLQEVQLDSFEQPTNHLGVALKIETTSAFVTVGEVEHNLAGESEARPTYQPGDRVELRAVSNAGFGHAFVGWAGDLSGDATPATLTLTKFPNVRAVFAPRTYQAWTFNQINPFITEPSYSTRAAIDADPDGDGFTNLLEYALGGLPEVSDAADIRPHLEISDAGEPVFNYRRQMAATDLIYRVWVSEDLITWRYNGDGSGETYTEELPDPIFNADGTETVTVRATEVVASADRLFFRLQVIQPPES